VSDTDLLTNCGQLVENATSRPHRLSAVRFRATKKSSHRPDARRHAEQASPLRGRPPLLSRPLPLFARRCPARRAITRRNSSAPAEYTGYVTVIVGLRREAAASNFAKRSPGTFRKGAGRRRAVRCWAVGDCSPGKHDFIVRSSRQSSRRRARHDPNPRLPDECRSSGARGDSGGPLRRHAHVRQRSSLPPPASSVAGKNWFDLVDYGSSNWLLPISGLGIALFLAWHVGAQAREEAFRSGSRFGRLYWSWVWLLRYLVPPAMWQSSCKWPVVSDGHKVPVDSHERVGHS
jgi:hypothetical protein